MRLHSTYNVLHDVLFPRRTLTNSERKEKKKKECLFHAWLQPGDIGRDKFCQAGVGACTESDASVAEF